VIEEVEELYPDRGAMPLLEAERLEHGEVHVLEARVAEDVPARGARYHTGNPLDVFVHVTGEFLKLQ
jgi:hypothetical protein